MTERYSHVLWVLTRLHEEKDAGLLIVLHPTYSELETRMIKQSVANSLEGLEDL